jgi:hypothetical protein
LITRMIMCVPVDSASKNGKSASSNPDAGTPGAGRL